MSAGWLKLEKLGKATKIAPLPGSGSPNSTKYIRNVLKMLEDFGTPLTLSGILTLRRFLNKTSLPVFLHLFRAGRARVSPFLCALLVQKPKHREGDIASAAAGRHRPHTFMCVFSWMGFTKRKYLYLLSLSHVVPGDVLSKSVDRKYMEKHGVSCTYLIVNNNTHGPSAHPTCMNLGQNYLSYLQLSHEVNGPPVAVTRWSQGALECME